MLEVVFFATFAKVNVIRAMNENRPTDLLSLSRDFLSEPFFPLFPYSNKPRGNTTHSEYVRLSEVEARRRRVNFRFPFSSSSLSCFHSVIALDLLPDLLPFSPPHLPQRTFFPVFPLLQGRGERERERKTELMSDTL